MIKKVYIRAIIKSIMASFIESETLFSNGKRRHISMQEEDTQRNFISGHAHRENIAKLSDERFMKMSASYEQEQKGLELTIAECEQIIRDADKAKVDLRMLMKGLREFTELKELTPEIVNTLIQRIEVHNSDRSTGKIRVQVDIYFTAIGLFTIPDEKELQKLMDEIRENPQKYKLSA